MRQGFFEKADLEAVLAKLPEPYAGMTCFACLSGWRKSEIRSLTWENVDRTVGEARIPTEREALLRTQAHPNATAEARNAAEFAKHGHFDSRAVYALAGAHRKYL